MSYEVDRRSDGGFADVSSNRLPSGGVTPGTLRSWLARMGAAQIPAGLVNDYGPIKPAPSGLVITLADVAVGLFFAGSSVATIVNQIENVRALLRVEVAEEIL